MGRTAMLAYGVMPGPRRFAPVTRRPCKAMSWSAQSPDAITRSTCIKRTARCIPLGAKLPGISVVACVLQPGADRVNYSRDVLDDEVGGP
jgi:hypothetical protein